MSSITIPLPESDLFAEIQDIIKQKKEEKKTPAFCSIAFAQLFYFYFFSSSGGWGKNQA